MRRQRSREASRCPGARGRWRRRLRALDEAVDERFHDVAEDRREERLQRTARESVVEGEFHAAPVGAERHELPVALEALERTLDELQVDRMRRRVVVERRDAAAHPAIIDFERRLYFS